MKRIKKRRHLKNWVKAFLFLSIVIVILSIVNFKYFNHIEINVDDKKNTSEEPNSKVKKVSMIMVGDNLIHDKIYLASKTSDGYDFKYILKYIKPLVSKYDIAYYNQETILGGSEIGVSSYPAFNSPYEVGDAMIDAGFNLVSLATNHTMDRGEGAIINSRNYWNSKSNVLAVGSYSSFEEKEKIDIREVNGISYTMLNYTYGLNGISIPSGKEYLVNVWPVNGNNPTNDPKYQEYKKQVKEDIDKVRDRVDLLIVAMHWGIEYQYSPNSYQEDMAKYLASLGVNIVIGTHPHVIEPITWIDNTLVIYSLGNFLSAHEVVDIGNRVGLMSMIDIYKKNGKITLNNLSNELLYTYYTSDYKDFLVIPFSKIDSNYLSNYKEVYDKYKSIVQELDNNIFIKEIKD